LASSDTKGKAIGQPYRFELELISENAELDLQSLLHQRAFLAFPPTAWVFTA
jgi:type VI secretion system secreted protein VgrG